MAIEFQTHEGKVKECPGCGSTQMLRNRTFVELWENEAPYYPFVCKTSGCDVRTKIPLSSLRGYRQTELTRIHIEKCGQSL